MSAANLRTSGGFTMPGETGHEDLVLDLARRWGADALRDSDGTELPEKFRQSGYPIYATVCLIRGDNEFARANRDKIQQIFLLSKEVLADADTVSVELMAGYRRDVYEVNASPESLAYWQVFDRTTGEELPADRWSFSAADGMVRIANARKWHRYTVSFLAFEIWEFINRYNHTVNHWTSEPQLPLDPAHPEVRERMKANLKTWLDRNAHVSVVRFTTFYYGNGKGGWGDYGRTVSPRALEAFRAKYGYRLTAETFVNGGIYNPTHRIPSKEYADWMTFQHDFFIEITRDYVEMVRARGKKVFFLLGDHWIGTEPLEGRFGELKLDGVVKSVFNGYEARIAGATETVPVREIRFHPYFFPREVTGKPTFCAKGTPTADLQAYWVDIRRACLRVRIDRIGFGGYVSLLKKFPDFVDYVTELSAQARAISELHAASAPCTAPVHVAVLNCWGRKRVWMCSGHMLHNNVYNQFLESLSGLPVHVEFLSFDEVLRGGIPAHVNVLVNAGRAGTAWSGGAAWREPRLVEAVSAFVARGGGLVGISEPSACDGAERYFQLAHILGVDREPLLCEENIGYGGRMQGEHFITQDQCEELSFVSSIGNLELQGDAARVIAWAKTGECPYFYEYLQPQVIANTFHNGRSVYFAGFKYNAQNTRALHRALFWAAGREDAFDVWRCDNMHAECACFPRAGKQVIVNNTRAVQHTVVHQDGGRTIELALEPLACVIRDI